MPRLPDKSELGQAAQPNRQSVTISGQGQDTGQAMLGAVAEGVGKIGQVMTEIELSEKKKDDALDLLRAESLFKGRTRDTEDALRQDPDHASYKPKWFESSTSAIEEAAAGIRSPEMREKWKAKARAEAETGYGRISNFAHQRATQEKEVEVENQLKDIQNQYMKQGITDERRKELLADAEQRVRLVEKSGLVLPNHAQRLREKHVETLPVEDLRRMIALDQSREVLKKLGYADQAAPGSARAAQEEPGMTPGQKPSGIDSKDVLGSSYRYFLEKGLAPHQAAAIAGNMRWESGGKPDLVNPGDNIKNSPDSPHSIGIGQWNDRVPALIKYARDNGVKVPEGDLRSVAYARQVAKAIPLETQLAFAWDEMQGSERKAFDRLSKSGDLQGATEGAISYHRPAGWTTRNPSAGHGFGDRMKLAKEAIDKYGEDGSRNPNKGTVGKGGSGDGDVEFENLAPMADDGLYSRISMKQRHALIHDARNALRGQTKRELDDGLGKLRNEGIEPVDSDGLTVIERARKERILDPNQLSDYEAKYKTTRAIYKATATVYDMTDEQIEEEKKKWDPQINPQVVQELGYAGAMTVVSDIDKMQKRVNEQRMKDAASAADQSTEVQKVIRKAQYLNPELQVGTDTDGNVRIIDKAGQPIPDVAFNSELIRARLEAQERWGIPEAERKIISRAQANDLISKKAIANMDDAKLRDYVRTAANKAEREYGKEHAEQAIDTALGWAMGADKAKDQGRIARSIINGEASRADIEKYMELDKLRTFGDYMQMPGGVRKGEPDSGRQIRTPNDSRPAISPAQSWEFQDNMMGYAQMVGQRRQPTPRNIEDLKANRDNPDAIKSFDGKFGGGEAAKILSRAK